MKEDLQYITDVYNWLYSTTGCALVNNANDGVPEAANVLNQLNLYLSTIEFFQLNDMFDRAHLEVIKLREWFPFVV